GRDGARSGAAPRAAARRQGAPPPARADRRDLRALRQLAAPVPVGVNPSVDALRATFGNAIGRAVVARDGETIVTVGRDALGEVMRWLRDSAGHCYDYLVDVTAVEYRDAERPIELVYFVRSLERRVDLRSEERRVGKECRCEWR